MNAELLANRALLGNALRMSPDTLEARVARLEEIVQQRNTQSRATAKPVQKPVAVKTPPRLDVAAMEREVTRRIDAMRAAELKILNRVSGRAA